MQKFGTSQSVLRKEDTRFLTGRGNYIGDSSPEDALVAVFHRSPVAHARIALLDVAQARAADGVVSVVTAGDFEGKMANAVEFDVLKLPGGGRAAEPVRPVLAHDRVRYVGEAIAMVVARSQEAALDALDLIECDFDDLPVHAATALGGETIHPEAPGNVAYDWWFGDEAATAEAFARAAHTVSLDLVDNRVIACPMETRGCWAHWDGNRLHVAFSGQGVWGLKKELARKFGLLRADVRVTTPDVGGGFGMKGCNYPEYFAVAHAARELGTPVRWVGTRSESMLSDVPGRDHVTRAQAAFDADHRLQAVRVDCVANLGAYNSNYGQFMASELMQKVMPGVYDFQSAYMRVKGIYSNTTPIDAYRGAGRPEAIYIIERLMDFSARQLGQDPIEFRRKSFISKEKFPYRTASGELYDVGDFHRVLDRALIEADIAGFPARRHESEKAGKLRGVGLSYYIESILGDKNETTTIAFADDGMVDVEVGTHSNGQGHETAFAQFLHDITGIDFDRIRVIQGDSDRIAQGGGTGGSRSVTMQGNSIIKTAREVIEAFRPLAEDDLEVAGADLTFEDGAFRVVGTDRSVDLTALADIARSKGRKDLLVTTREFVVHGRSYPNGAHFAEVEIDPETGDTRVVKYTVVDDFGYLVNPMLAEGQVHGGVVQGIGQAITENVVYSEDGQLLSGSFMDYGVPRAEDVPFMGFFSEPVPSTANDIGMKGCGEAGTVGALAAVTNAALDALWDVGVRHVDMPLTPIRVWTWLQQARQAAE